MYTEKTLSLIILSVVVIGLTGCNLAPPYRRPEAPVSSTWPTGSAYRIEKGDRPLGTKLSWQEFYHDKHLQEIIALALKNNRDLKLAILNVERTRALYGIQKAELYPSVSAAASGSKSRLPADLSPTGKATTQERYDVALGITAWEIDFFGRLRNLRDQALDDYLAEDFARRSAEILLISTVVNAYITLTADREILKLLEMMEEAQRKTLDLVKKRYDLGLASEIELNQAKSQVDAIKGETARIIQKIAQDENTLRFLVGTDIKEELLSKILSELNEPPEISAGLPSEILLQRPDVLAAEERLKAAHANIGAARAAFFPRISLTTSFGTASAELSGLFKSGSATWNFVPQLAVPIFDARTWSAYDVAKVNRDILLTQYEKTLQIAFKEVADALAAESMLKEQLDAHYSLVSALEKTYTLSLVRYEKGIDSYLNVLDAQRSLLAAKQALVNLRLSRFANRAILFKVLGGGNK